MTHTQIPTNYTEKNIYKENDIYEKNMMKYVIHCTNCRTQTILFT